MPRRECVLLSINLRTNDLRAESTFLPFSTIMALLECAYYGSVYASAWLSAGYTVSDLEANFEQIRDFLHADVTMTP